MSSMKPMALAALLPSGPAEMVFTRTLYFRPASYASTRVSDSSAAFAELMPPPYPARANRAWCSVRTPKLVAMWGVEGSRVLRCANDRVRLQPMICMGRAAPGTMRSEARYVSEMAAPPGFMSGPKRCNMDT